MITILMETVRARKIPYVIRILIAGATRSKTAISFENLVRMRPIGLESKNKILERSTFSHMAKCRFDVVVKAIPNIVASLIANDMHRKIRMPNRTRG